MSSIGGAQAQDRSLLERLLGQAAQLTKAWGTYVLAVGAPIVGWTQFRDQLAALDFGPADPWKLPIVFGVPLAIAALKTVIDLHSRRVERQRRLWVAKGPPIPGYFRLTPYQSDDEFDRADGAHQRILAWLQSTDASLLYLTGRSGSGKSSILNAYVVPALKAEPTNACVVEASAYDDPLSDIAAALVAPGAVWNRPPDDTGDLQQLLQRATQYLKGRRLILILDQFEEFVILHEDETTRAPLREFLSDIVSEPMSALTVLLTLRDDYLVPTREALFLPRPEMAQNWEQVPMFVHGAADAFLRASHEGGLDTDLVRRVLEEAADIEESPGLYRPITLNMLGFVIAETTGRSKVVPTQEVLHDYLRRRLRDPLVREFGPSILRLMVTRYRTKRPLTETEIEAAIGIPRLDIEGTLGKLEADGLVRRFVQSESRKWDVAHDFVARLLAVVLAGWRETIWRIVRPWLAPAVVTLWLATLAAGIPFYLNREHEQAVTALSAFGIAVRSDPQEFQRYSIRAPASIWSEMETEFFWRQLGRLRGPIIELDLSSAGRITDLGPLAGLTNLQMLDLSDAGEITDLGPLTGLTQLQMLDLSGADKVSDLGPLAGLTNLQTLILSGAREIADLGPLTGLTKLRVLDLSGAERITDLEPLAGLTNLQSLDLSKAEESTDLSPLAGPSSLQTLDRSGTGLGLAGLTQALALIDTDGIVDPYSIIHPIQLDLGPLAGLTNLQTLILRNADGITDLGPLAGLTNLQTLDLSCADGITSAQIERLRAARDIPNFFYAPCSKP